MTIRSLADRADQYKAPDGISHPGLFLFENRKLAAKEESDPVSFLAPPDSFCERGDSMSQFADSPSELVESIPQSAQNQTLSTTPQDSEKTHDKK
ncbi:hypothetical protein FDK21_04435 [Cohaesibacter sp. CAU 1516]|uniref:hypothetical protein n=1 Tax=Cohaesibacter sp. CAU 1516 TaxID=2576038 RepID=UPI0010FD778D|nr:hypothetical protein [Cohaesibacter sp. CAU 1516]TLP48899.1 hypothetical protein FDK21_04435 [Cohaesibacter sp. CAU 1516]